jgi:DNA-binding transcriptional MerR regulator
MHETYTPHQVGQLLGVNSYTVRRWCADYPGHLSANANPEKGNPRRLTGQDVEVLREVQRMRAEGLQTPAINERLSEVIFQAPVVEASPASPAHPQLPISAGAIVEALQSVVAPVEARLQVQDVRLQALESQRPTWRDVFIIGLAALMVGVMIGLSIWWFQ